METKTIVIIGLLVMLIVFVAGGIFQKNTGLFSTLTSTRTCSDWATNTGLPYPLTLPYTWQYTTSQQRCITAMTTGTSGGCVITYNTGACNTQCTPNWNCGTCVSGSQSCTDSNNCETPNTKTQSCTNTCTPNWQCGTCTSGSQTCTDPNNCESPNTKTQSCSSTCTPGTNKCYGSNTYQTCLGSGSWSGVLSCSGNFVCTNGNCVNPGGCNTAFDTNCDGTVSNTEILTAITQWTSNSISDSQILSAIQAWVS